MVDGPEAVVVACATDDDCFALLDGDSVLCEPGFIAMVTELSNREESTVGQAGENVGLSGCQWEVRHAEECSVGGSNDGAVG